MSVVGKRRIMSTELSESGMVENVGVGVESVVDQLRKMSGNVDSVMSKSVVRGRKYGDSS